MTKVGVAGRSSGSKVEEKKKRGIADGGRRLAAEIIQRVPASAPGLQQLLPASQWRQHMRTVGICMRGTTSSADGS